MVLNKLLETLPKMDFWNNKTPGIFYYLKNSVAQYPHKPYVVDHGITWTYAAVYERVQALARQLKASDIKPGDRIILFVDNSIDYIIAFFTIFLLDCVVVPVNKYTSQENFKAIIRETTPGGVITNKVFQQKINSRELPKNVSLFDIEIRDVAFNGQR
jgi:acyl-CoA synthetase (AMP-forming)/AMP-acid ligase II